MDRPQTLDLEAEPSAQARGRSGMVLLMIAGGAPTLGTLGGFAGGLWWPLDLLAALRIQYVVVLMAVVTLSLLVRSWRAALLFLLPLALNLLVMAPLYRHPEPVARAAAPPLPPPTPSMYSDEWLAAPAGPGDMGEGPSQHRPLRIMNFNTRPNPRTAEAVLDHLREAQADILVLQELSQATMESLEYQIAPFRVRQAEPGSAGYGLAVAERIGLRSRSNITNVRSLELIEHPARIKAIEAEVQWSGRTIMLLAVQAIPPLSSREAVAHAQQVQAIASWVRQQQQRPVVVVGNMAATPWSWTMSRLTEVAGLVNSQHGFGVQPNWPSSGGPLGQIPIDHVLHSPDLLTVKRTLGPSLGSDHQSVTAALWWVNPPPPPPAPTETPAEGASAAPADPAPATTAATP